MKERVSENPLAYTGNKLHFELTEAEIEKSKKKINWREINRLIVETKNDSVD